MTNASFTRQEKLENIKAGIIKEEYLSDSDYLVRAAFASLGRPEDAIFFAKDKSVVVRRAYTKAMPANLVDFFAKETDDEIKLNLYSKLNTASLEAIKTEYSDFLAKSASKLSLVFWPAILSTKDSLSTKMIELKASHNKAGEKALLSVL